MTKNTIKTITDDDTQALVNVMDELITKQLALKSQLKEVEKEIEKMEFLMKDKLQNENANIITCGYWSFGWEYKNRTAFDQSKFKEEYPHLYNEFKTTKETKSFKFGHRG